MGRKYIIEIGRLERLYKAFIGAHGKPEITWLSPEVDLTPYTEPDIEKVRKEAYDKAFEDAEQVAKSGKRVMYQKGLKDAWEAAKKVVALSTVDRRKVFGSEYMYSILEKHTASEAIEKLKAYEQEQNEIQVGDEVISPNGKGVVTEIKDIYVRIMYAKGSGQVVKPEDLTKTGRHFPEIAEVLAKMKESE